MVAVMRWRIEYEDVHYGEVVIEADTEVEARQAFVDCGYRGDVGGVGPDECRVVGIFEEPEGEPDALWSDENVKAELAEIDRYPTP